MYKKTFHFTIFMIEWNAYFDSLKQVYDTVAIGSCNRCMVSLWNGYALPVWNDTDCYLGRIIEKCVCEICLYTAKPSWKWDIENGK